ncbi:leucine--tRNA ligase [Patescibacteria group bacterium]|nr:leucine--tRNA ligase [Patescibacteria group bacterium]
MAYNSPRKVASAATTRQLKKYNPQRIERKWQRVWERGDFYRAKDLSKKPKSYILVEFPYPSGDGLHVGHCRSYVALDIVARKRRMEGLNVLFPMGWDAFGLPTENYAIKTGIHPRIVTKKNTAFFKRQEKSLGLSFDWSREINTTDPAYYKWTQWIFIQLFKKNLAYKARIPINWCPDCKIGLANEEVIDGRCERCGKRVTKKEKEQWMLKITKYAERLIKDLEKVDYPERVKALQKDWIGKSEGTTIKFQISNFKFQIDVFTTRADTLFGATFLVLAPEHPAIESLKSKIRNYKFVERYIKEARKKTEKERIIEIRNKIGVEIKGIKAVNPVNNREIQIFIADYVLLHYGTGAIMAVPAHDQRDLNFAKQYNLSIIDVIKPIESRSYPSTSSGSRAASRDKLKSDQAYEGEGVLINSGRFNGMKSDDAKKRIVEWLARDGKAKRAVSYKLRDWIFSRQRYWGEPIPMIKCQKCGWLSAPEKDLPIELPRVKEYKPTEKGESPLVKVKSWVNTKCPKCNSPAERETDVMPNWAGSNWYYLRYCDPRNKKSIFSQKLLKYWMPVDWYNGGMEHATLHLLYSRFIYKFLWDIKAVPRSLGVEPYKKRTSHGVILGEGGIKMSKSKGNVISPEQVIKEYGADTLRIYEMFIGPFEQTIAWDAKGIKGARRFLERVWRLAGQFFVTQNSQSSPDLKKLFHKTIKKVSEDIESLKFNTAVSSLMEFSNAWQADRRGGLGKKDFKDFLKVLSPFAPHLTQELWGKIGFKSSIHNEKWPKYDPTLIKEEIATFIVQVQGRVRGKIEAEIEIPEEKLKKLALSQEKIKKWIIGKKIKKTIFIPGKLINFVL